MIARNYSQIVKEINDKVTLAVKDTADEMQIKLKEFIQEDYYNQYDPTSYIPRTYKFLNSAVAKMLGNSSASIGIDEAYFDYEYPTRYNLRDGSSGHWTGEYQAQMGSRGYHGSAYIQTEGRFWDDFLKWADDNALVILKRNLIKYGVPIK